MKNSRKKLLIISNLPLIQATCKFISRELLVLINPFHIWILRQKNLYANFQHNLHHLKRYNSPTGKYLLSLYQI